MHPFKFIEKPELFHRINTRALERFQRANFPRKIAENWTEEFQSTLDKKIVEFMSYEAKTRHYMIRYNYSSGFCFGLEDKAEVFDFYIQN